VSGADSYSTSAKLHGSRASPGSTCFRPRDFFYDSGAQPSAVRYKQFPPLQEAARYNLDENFAKLKMQSGSRSD